MTDAQKNCRIDTCFARLAEAGRSALMPFVTAGDPLPEAIPELLDGLVAGGADLIELGVPFSDPAADGPVIQHASERALAAGVRLRDVLAAVRAFRQGNDSTPIIVMGYANPVEAYGWQAFAEDAAAAGVDGVLLVDCPIEEYAITEPLRRAGLQQILLAAPTTGAARLARACELARGFVYYVSFAGVTGAGGLAPEAIAEAVQALRRQAQVPVAVGFGVRDAASAVQVAGFADGVVIGSALVETLAAAESVDDMVARARAFLEPVRAALDNPSRSA